MIFCLYCQDMCQCSYISWTCRNLWEGLRCTRMCSVPVPIGSSAPSDGRNFSMYCTKTRNVRRRRRAPNLDGVSTFNVQLSCLFRSSHYRRPSNPLEINSRVKVNLVRRCRHPSVGDMVLIHGRDSTNCRGARRHVQPEVAGYMTL